MPPPQGSRTASYKDTHTSHNTHTADQDTRQTPGQARGAPDASEANGMLVDHRHGALHSGVP